MKVKESADEQIYLSDYNPDVLENISSTQSNITLQQEEQL